MDREMLRKNVIHQNALFPVTVYSYKSKNKNFLDCHRNDEWQIVLITEGKAFFQIEASNYEVSAGQAVFIYNGGMHSAYSLDISNCGCYTIVFSPGILFENTYDSLQEKFINPLLKGQNTLPVYISGKYNWENRALSQIKEIVRACTDKSYTYELQTKAHLYSLFSLLFANENMGKMKSESLLSDYKEERLKQILEYIHMNYDKKISLQGMAESVNMSEGYFCRFFKQLTGQTPVDYTNCYRVKRVLDLLKNSNSKVFCIAQDAGFNNYSHFINTFKRYLKCTPSEYRYNNQRQCSRYMEN